MFIGNYKKILIKEDFMKRFIPAIIVLLILLTGCFKTYKMDDPELYDKHLTRSFNYSREKSFNATLAALKEMKTGIEKVDIEKGIIITDKAVYEERFDRGKLHTFKNKYYFQITGNGNNSTVKVYKYREWDNNVELEGVYPPYQGEKLWNPLFKEIQNQLDVR